MCRLSLGFAWLLVGAVPIKAQPATDDARITATMNKFGSFELVDHALAEKTLSRLLPKVPNATSPSWSPDGRKLLLTKRVEDKMQIHLLDLETGQINNLTRTKTNEHEPAWSPDGARIAFTSERTGDREIFVMRVDGSHPTNLTDNSASDSAPAWAPDGQRLLFSTNRAGSGWRVYSMDSSGGNVQEIIHDSLAGNVNPTWSPDGRQIVYAGPSQDRQSMQLFVANADGTGVQQLTSGPGQRTHAAWSPDGRFIAYLHFDRALGQRLNRPGRLMLFDPIEGASRPLDVGGETYSASGPVWKPSPTGNGGATRTTAGRR